MTQITTFCDASSALAGDFLYSLYHNRLKRYSLSMDKTEERAPRRSAQKCVLLPIADRFLYAISDATNSEVYNIEGDRWSPAPSPGQKVDGCTLAQVVVHYIYMVSADRPLERLDFLDLDRGWESLGVPHLESSNAYESLNVVCFVSPTKVLFHTYYQYFLADIADFEQLRVLPDTEETVTVSINDKKCARGHNARFSFGQRYDDILQVSRGGMPTWIVGGSHAVMLITKRVSMPI